MSQPPTEQEIEKLLEQLWHWSPENRVAAAKSVANLETQDERVVNALETLATKDNTPSVRDAATSALLSMGRTLPAIESPSPIETRDLVIGFLGWLALNGIFWAILSSFPNPGYGNYFVSCVGFPVMIIANIIYVIMFRTFRKKQTDQTKRFDFIIGFVLWSALGMVWLTFTKSTTGLFLGPFLFFLNLVILVVFVFSRRWLALGILTAYAINFTIALLLGVAANGICGTPFFLPDISK